MMIETNPIAIDYSDEKLGILVEEFIIRQKTTFTFKEFCSYILYWAMEEGRITNSERFLSGSNELLDCDQERIRRILDKIVLDGRIA